MEIRSRLSREYHSKRSKNKRTVVVLLISNTNILNITTILSSKKVIFGSRYVSLDICRSDPFEADIFCHNSQDNGMVSVSVGGADTNTNHGREGRVST